MDASSTLERSGWWLPWLLAGAAGAAAGATLGDYGLTIDEPINLGHGKTMTAVVFGKPAALLTADGVRAVWENGHEHPPLTRFLVGCAQRVADAHPEDPRHLVPSGGRWASVGAFAAIIFLATRFGLRLGGPFAGACAGLAVALQPRLFAHAHFASPEVLSAAFMLWACCAAWYALQLTFGQSASTFKTSAALAFAGVVLGLALLTKLTAVLVPVFVGVAALGTFGFRTLPWLVIWGSIGVATFVAGWPWMWPFDFPGQPPGLAGTFERLRQFVSSAGDRATLYVWYIDRQYAGNQAPWHFAAVFFAATIPLVTFALGLVGAGLGWKSVWGGRRLLWLGPLAAWAVSLLVFSLPIHRYDGERLFLFAFPFWGLLAGVGAATLAQRFVGYGGMRLFVQSVVLVGLCWPVLQIARMHPFELSYYSPLVGGLHGADRLGLEATYWGETLTPRLLDKLANIAEPESAVAVLPTLYPGHAVYQRSPQADVKRLQFVPGEYVLPPGAKVPDDKIVEGPLKYAVLFNRRGYLIDPIPKRAHEEGAVVAQETFDGVWLSRAAALPDGWRWMRPKTK